MPSAHPDLIRSFDKIRNHFGMNRVAQAGALAALRDQGLAGRCAGPRGRRARRDRRIAAENGLTALPSATNFVAVDCGGDGAFARSCPRRAGRARVFVRKPFVAPQDRCIRVSCGRPGPGVLAEALPEALAEARA